MSDFAYILAFRLAESDVFGVAIARMNKGGHPNGYPPLLKTDYNLDTTSEAVQKAVHTVTLNLLRTIFCHCLQNNVEKCKFL